MVLDLGLAGEIVGLCLGTLSEAVFSVLWQLLLLERGCNTAVDVDLQTMRIYFSLYR